MIYLVTSYTEPAERFVASLEGRLDGLLTVMSVDDLFSAESVPVGHYILAGMERLTRVETDLLADFAAALRKAAPDARILNPPHRHLDRLALLRRLKAAGINDFDVWQLDCGERPDRFPVFIRPADGHNGAETDLLADEEAFDAALAYLERKRIPLRGRIAVEYAAERSPDGVFRKYGVVNIGGTMVPQHILRSNQWMVKSSKRSLTPELAREELEFTEKNPHAHVLKQVFDLAGVDFGRVDYGVVNGHVQIYEINTNPHLPRFEKTDERSERRAMIAERMIVALRAVDTPLPQDRRVDFATQYGRRQLKMKDISKRKPLTPDRIARRIRRFTSSTFLAGLRP